MNRNKTKLIALFSIMGALLLGATSITSSKQKNTHEVNAANFTQITSASQITSGKSYLITTNRYNTTNYRYLPRFNSASNAPAATTFTDVSLLADTTTWTFTSVSGGWEITQNSIKLYSTNSNNGLRSAASPANGYVWTIENSVAEYGSGRLTIKNNLDTPRYITLYQVSDWRSYTTVYTKGNDQEGNLVLYELQESSATLQSISVTTPPSKTTYFEGESFDKTGMVVTAIYDTLPSANVTSAVTISPNPLTTSTNSVSISYTEGGVTKTTTQAVTVNPVILNSLTIKTPASKTTFAFGDLFNYDGLVVTANFNNGSVDLVGGFSVGVVDTKVLGTQTVTITYQGKSTSYTINVTNQGANFAPVYATGLIISEYIEGSSNDKAIEIYNGTGSSVSLTNYNLKIGANGAAWGSAISLSGTLAHGATHVVANTSANANILAKAGTKSGSLTHNGDDAIGLFNNTTLIDVFGTYLSDPGTGWDVGGITNATVDHVLVRKASVLSPKTVWDTDEWLVYDNNTITYLGSHTMTLPTSITSLEQATAFANYVMTGIGLNAGGNCVEVLNVLETEFGYMVANSKTEFNTNSGALFVSARARMAYLTAWVAANSESGSAINITSSQSIYIIVIVSILGISTLAGYYFIRKRPKEEIN